MKFDFALLEKLGTDQIILLVGFVLTLVFVGLWAYLVIPLRWYYSFFQVKEGSTGRIATLRQVWRAKWSDVATARATCDPTLRAQVNAKSRMGLMYGVFYSVILVWGILTLILVARILLRA